MASRPLSVRIAPTLALFSALALPTTAAAQVASPWLDDVALLHQVGVGQAQVQLLDLPAITTTELALDIQLGHEAHTLLFAPHSMRSADFTLIAVGRDGPESVEPGPLTTVRGSLAGEPGSVMAGALVDGRMEALIRRADGTLWGIQAVPGAADRREHAVYTGADLLPHDGTCGTPELPGAGTPPTAGAADGGAATKVCEIACDADVEYYESNGSSVPQTEADIESILNSTEVIYLFDALIRYEITTIIVRTTENDPYSSTSPNTLLGQFDSHWSSQQQGIQRDIAHLFTGKDIDGGVIGIAKLSTICSQNNGFGLSQSQFSNNFASRVALTAHELGHNWSAAHCDGQGDCSIMCSGLGGCTGVITSFGNSAINSILQEKNSSGCLADGAPADGPSISSINPTSLQIFSGGGLTIHGNEFLGATSVNIGPDVYGLGEFTIESATRIQVTLDDPSQLGEVVVSVTNPIGTSNTATFTWAGAQPPVLVVPQFWTTVQPYSWLYAGDQGDTAYLIISLSASSFQFAGWSILAAPIILNVEVLGPSGASSLSTDLPASAVGLTFHNQIVTFDTAIVGASAIKSTTVLF